MPAPDRRWWWWAATPSGRRGASLAVTWLAGRIAAVSDQTGRRVSYAYNVAGDLVTVTAVDATTTYGYDSSHRITSVRDAAGRVTTNVYDGQGRVVSQTEPGSRTTSF